MKQMEDIAAPDHTGPSYDSSLIGTYKCVGSDFDNYNYVVGKDRYLGEITHISRKQPPQQQQSGFTAFTDSEIYKSLTSAQLPTFKKHFRPPGQSDIFGNLILVQNLYLGNAATTSKTSPQILADADYLNDNKDGKGGILR
jgi:hypothetical protein